MLDFGILPFGTKVYYVDKEQNNIYFRKTVTKTDSDGIVWFRYDKPIAEYDVEEFIYTGYIEHINIGEVDSEVLKNLENIFYLRSTKDQSFYPYTSNDFPTERLDDYWFATKEEALEEIANREQADRLSDMV